jgi:RsiW-degrading membrane proteinase PrsW (M82 family)
MRIPVLLRLIFYIIIPSFALAYSSIYFFGKERTFRSQNEEFEFLKHHKFYLPAFKTGQELLKDDLTNPDLHYWLLRCYIGLTPNEIALNAPRLKDRGYPWKFYDSLGRVPDPVLSDISKLLRACLYTNLENDKAISFLDSISNRSMIHLNEMYGTISVSLSESVDYYKKEIQLHPRNENAYRELIICLRDSEKYEEATHYIHLADSNGIPVHSRIKRSVFMNYSYGTLFTFVYSIPFRNVFNIGTIGAICILAAWLLFLFKINVFREPVLKDVIITTLLAVLINPLCLVIYEIFGIYDLFTQDTWRDNILSTGLIEEFIKFLPVVLLMIIRRGSVNSPFQVLFYGTVSALIFAFMENILYFNNYYDIDIIARRALIASVHVVSTGIVCYGYILFRFRSKNFSWLFSCFAFAAIFHGTYNTFLTHEWYPVSVFLVLIGNFAWSSMVNNTINCSPGFDKEVKEIHIPAATWFISGLSFVILAEFFLNTFQYGKTTGLEVFESSIVGQSLFLLTFAFAITRFEIVKDKWTRLDFLSTRTVIQSDSYLLKKIMISSIGKNSFVQLVAPLKGIVTQKIQASDDENWFLVETENPQMKKILIRFKEEGDNFLDFNVIIFMRKIDDLIPEDRFNPAQFSFLGLYKISPETEE